MPCSCLGDGAAQLHFAEAAEQVGMEASLYHEPRVGPDGCTTDSQPDLASTFTLVDVFPTLYPASLLPHL